MNSRLLSNNKGVGLLEVMVSMLVLAIGLVGLAPMVIVSIDGNKTSQEHATAASLLKEKVEYWTGLNEFPAMPVEDAESDLEGGFTRTTYVADNSVDTTIPPDLFQVDVSVSWTDMQGIQRSSSYSTFVLKD